MRLATMTVLLLSSFATGCATVGQSSPTDAYCLTHERPSVSEATLQAMTRDELEALDDALTFYDMTCT